MERHLEPEQRFARIARKRSLFSPGHKRVVIMREPEQTLAILLRIVGLVSFSAIIPTFMPFAWMEAAHGWLGLGELPDAPIVHYLTRSTSLLYAAHGAVVVYVSFNVRRYLPALRFTAVVLGFCGVSMTTIDLWSGLPWFWAGLEGPFLIVAALVLGWLTGRIPSPPDEGM